jgi:DNA-binding MarR family transcriptional regulator
LPKYSRDELVQEFIAAIRASQTANQTLDHALAEYLGIDPTAFRCLDILDQEGPMTAGQLAERARLSPAAMTALLDRLEDRGFASRTRDTEDRRRVLVAVAPELRERAAELYGPLDEAGDELSSYSDEQLQFLIEFLRGSVAYQEERMRRLDAIKASGGRSSSRTKATDVS